MSSFSHTGRFAAVAGGAAILATVVFAIYGRAVRSPFIFDDRATVLTNRSIVQLWPLVDRRGNPSPLNPQRNTPTAGRPLVNLSLAINYRFGQLDPLGYHLANITLHALAAILLSAASWRMLGLERLAGQFSGVAGLLSFFVALIWAVHPLQTESVTYITQRTEVMMGLFYLATIFCALGYWDARTRGSRVAWLVAATVACLLGALSKEVIASAPLIVLLIERTFITKSFVQAARKSWPLYVGLSLSWLVLAAQNVRGARTPAAGFDLGVPATAWWFTQAKVLFMYLKLSVWPWPLVIHYEMPYLNTLAAAWPWLVAVALLVLVGIALLWRRYSAGFLICSVLIILSPTLLVPLVTEVAAERRMYLPLAGLVALVVVGGYWLLARLAELIAGRLGSSWTGLAPLAATGAAACAIAIVLSLVSVRRLAAYHDELTLWLDAAQHQPENYVVRMNCGTLLATAGRPQEAALHFTRAVSLKPGSADAHFSLGRALADAGRPAEAQSQYAETVRLDPNYAAAHYNLGQALLDAGQVTQARGHLQEAVRIKPDFAAAHNNLAIALASAGQLEESVAHFQEALRLEPDAQGHANLAMVYARLNRHAEAVEAGQQAVQLALSQGQDDLAQELEGWLQALRTRSSR